MPELTDKARQLRRSPDFALLDDAALEAVAAISTAEKHPAAIQLLDDDSASDALYVITAGHIQATWRSASRRAPLPVTLSVGGVVGQDALGGSGHVGAWTAGPVEVLRIDPERLRGLAAEHRSIKVLLARMVAVQGKRQQILTWLRKSPLFSRVSPVDLAAILPGSLLVHGEPGALIFDGRDVLPGVAVVIRGDVRVESTGRLRVGRKTYTPRPVFLGEGGVIGDTALISPGPLMQDVTAGHHGCQVLLISDEAFRTCFIASAGFRRAILSSPILEPEDKRSLMMGMATATPAEETRIFYTVLGDERTVPVGTLTSWLAHSAAQEWGDRLVIVQVDPSVTTLTPGDETRYDGGGHVSVVRAPVDRPKITPEMVETLVGSHLALLDLSRVTPTQAGPWLTLTQRVVLVSSHAYKMPDEWLPTELGLGLPIYTAVVPSPPLRAGEDRLVPFGNLRIHRDLVAEAARDTPLASLSSGLRAQVSRWMRGVTGRRLGVALGGGGALSFAELAMLQRLHEEGIPVDLVAGVSGGAMVGAFYAAGMDLEIPAGLDVPDELRGLPGLAILTAVGAELEVASNKALFSGWAVADFIEKYLGHQRLEDLLVPFLPVAIDSDRAVQRSVRAGPVAFGARASGSFPGPFTPTTSDRTELQRPRRFPPLRRNDLPTLAPGTRRHVRWLDGGLLNNIPDDTLFEEGAQLVLACNVVPAPRPRDETSAKPILAWQSFMRQRANRVARFVRELEPVIRLDDLMRAIYMLLYQPADWAVRPANVKYQAETVGFTFTEWSKGDAIRRQALEGEAGACLDKAVDDIRASYRAMRWQDLPVEDEEDVATLTAHLRG